MSLPAPFQGPSRQDWATPPEFLAAVKRRIHIYGFAWDLAASAENSIVSGNHFYNEEQNSLIQPWTDRGYDDDYDHWCWLNPPYSNIKPWVEKCALESKAGAHIACLVPASTGANWWLNHVVNDAYILFLNGRLTFVGADAPYPRDLALLLYTPFIRSGSVIWDWREEM